MSGIFDLVIKRKKAYEKEIQLHSDWVNHNSPFGVAGNDDYQYIENLKKSLNKMDQMIQKFIEDFDREFPEI